MSNVTLFLNFSYNCIIYNRKIILKRMILIKFAFLTFLINIFLSDHLFLHN